MPRRSIIYTDHSPPRIDPPTFPPKTATHDSNNNPQSTEHTTYPDVLATCIAPDLSAEDPVEKYDDWLKRLKSDKSRIPNDILSVTPSTASLIKKYNKKAKKAAKVDQFKLFQEGRDDPVQPYYQRHIRLVDTRLSMKPDKKKKKEEGGPRRMEDLFEGTYGCVGVMDVEPIEEVKVDINDALDLRPIVNPEDAQAIQKLVKNQKSKLKPYMKKYSGGILDDPLLKKWAEEDSHLKRGVPRIKPPLIPIYRPGEYGPSSLEEVYIMVDNTAQLPEVSYKHKYGDLGGIVPDRMDGLDMGLLHRMDPPIYHPIPVLNTRKKSKIQYEQERRPPFLSREKMEQMEMEIQATYNQQRNGRGYRNGRPQSTRVQGTTPLYTATSKLTTVPNISGVYDHTLKSYTDFLSDDENNDPWVEKMRGIGALTSSLDWESPFLNHPQRYHVQAARCDTAAHRAHNESPSTARPRSTRTVGQSRRLARTPIRSEGPANPDVVDTRSNASTHNPNLSSKRKRDDESAQAEKPQSAIDPRLDMPALRDIVLIPEAKIDHKKIRTVEPMASAQELTNFFADILHPDCKALTIYDKSQTKKQPIPKQAKVDKPKFDWKDHKSIKNPKWYASSLRLCASRNNDPIPTYISNSVLQIRPIFRAIESVNFNPVEIESEHIQHVDMILSPSTGVIFTPLAKLPMNHTKLLNQIKGAAFYYSRVVVVVEVMPYRLFKDPKSLAECTPLNEDIVKGLSTFKRAVEVSINNGEGLIGTTEFIYAINGAGEVASVLRGISIKLDNELLRICKGETLGVWQDRSWVYKPVDKTEEEYLVAAGFNLYSTHFILHLCGSFAGFAEGLTAKERLEKVGPVVGPKVVTRFNAKWWRRQVETRQLENGAATSETL